MTKKRTAGYVRVSTAQQVETGTSIDDQIEKINEEAKSRNWKKPEIYADKGISGKSSHRPALQQMLKDTSEGRFDAIIFSKLDRLARNLRDTLNIYDETEKYGTVMICLDNPVINTDGPMGSMMLQIMGAFAQFERDLIKSRTVAGRMKTWKNGTAYMGKLPFGYIFNKEASTIEIDEEKEKIVHKIYSLYLDNRLSMIDVANKLTDDGIPTPSALAGRKDASTHWNANTIAEILKSESYTGKPVSYNQHKFKWNDKNKIYKSKEKKDQSEWIIIEFPKILDESKHLQVQARIKHNKAIPKKKPEGYKSKFMAENFLRCGQCKSKMSKQASGGRKYIYYACPRRRASAKKLKSRGQERCSLPFMNSDKIDAAIFNQIIDLITNPKRFAAEWIRNKPVEELTTKVKLLTEKQEKLKNRLKKAVQIEINTDDTELTNVCKQEREKIENDFHAVKNELNLSQNELNFHTHKIKKLEEFQEIFTLTNRGDGMKVKFALKRALNKLPFDDKKRLMDAVISPEMGGCVYVRQLEPEDIEGDIDFHLEEDSNFIEDAPHPTEANVIPLHSSTKEEEEEEEEEEDDDDDDSKWLKKQFVIEMDFTLETSRIIEIIQSMGKSVINLGKSLFYAEEIHTLNL